MDKDTKTAPSYPGSAPMVRIDGAKIRHLRESQKLTQLYVSTIVGVTTDTISRWENRHYQTVKLENAQKLAQALEVDFNEIVEQEEEPKAPDRPVEEAEPPKQETGRPAIPRQYGRLSLLLAVIVAGALLYSMFSRPVQVSVSATRILPPHVAPGQEFPVLIRIAAAGGNPVPLIINEIIPQDSQVRQGVPAITKTGQKDHSLKWISRTDGGNATYAYLCRAPENISQGATLTFDGALTLKENIRSNQSITGQSSLVIAPFHWADANRDSIIDDEEILTVYDLYSDIKELPLNRELIDTLWAGSSYAWDSRKNAFAPVD